MYYYLLTTVVFFAMIYYPTYRLIYVLSVRRLQKKLDLKLDAEQVKGQARRAHFITIILLTIFCATYNSYLMGKLNLA